MIEQPDGFLAGVARLAREHGVLLIVDEVATGFARAGGMFACDVEGVRADIVCMGKGISGGYLPLAATVCSDDVARSFDGEAGEERTLYHGHTYTGNPLACAAGIASFDLLIENEIVAHADSVGELMEREVIRGLAAHPNVGDVRRRGVMMGIELVRSRSPWTPFERSSRVGRAVCESITRAGAMVRPLGDVVVLNPAPALDMGTCGRLIEGVVDGINSFDFSRHAR
jgi:adenosylmethionine-8-amino-7-oxononanoate aminotransferase